MNPWPVAFTKLEGKTVRIWATQVKEPTGTSNTTPGAVLAIDKSGITVAAGDGSILLTELQAQGSKRMSAHAFTLGHRINVHDRFGTE